MGAAVRLVMKSFSSDSQNSDQTTHTTGINQEDLLTCYHSLYTSFGDQGWWPSSGWFETIIGAVLAQNVSWGGASQAVSSLKDAGLLDPEKILQSSQEVIAPLIRSSRYYNQKAERILIFVRFFADRYGSDSTRMNKEDTGILRSLLLNLKGFGPETVDSILLYACEKPVFVVDAYTRRIGSRIGLFKADASYQQMQDFFMARLNPDTRLFNDYHAQIVHLGNIICRTKPLCKSCPLRKMDGRLQCTYDHTDP